MRVIIEFDSTETRDLKRIEPVLQLLQKFGCDMSSIIKPGSVNSFIDDVKLTQTAQEILIPLIALIEPDKEYTAAELAEIYNAQHGTELSAKQISTAIIKMGKVEKRHKRSIAGRLFKRGKNRRTPGSNPSKSGVKRQAWAVHATNLSTYIVTSEMKDALIS